MKLSPKQKEVIRLMRDGWELCEGLIIHWLQRDDDKYEIIDDGDTKALLRLRVIEPLIHESAPLVYTLTDLGKTIKL